MSDFNNTEDMDLFVNVINSAQIKDTADDFKNRHNNGEANRQNIHRKSKRGNVKPTPSRNKRNPSKNKDYIVVKKSVAGILLGATLFMGVGLGGVAGIYLEDKIEEKNMISETKGKLMEAGQEKMLELGLAKNIDGEFTILSSNDAYDYSKLDADTFLEVYVYGEILNAHRKPYSNDSGLNDFIQSFPSAKGTSNCADYGNFLTQYGFYEVDSNGNVTNEPSGLAFDNYMEAEMLQMAQNNTVDEFISEHLSISNAKGRGV